MNYWWFWINRCSGWILLFCNSVRLLVRCYRFGRCWICCVNSCNGWDCLICLVKCCGCRWYGCWKCWNYNSLILKWCSCVCNGYVMRICLINSCCYGKFIRLMVSCWLLSKIVFWKYNCVFSVSCWIYCCRVVICYYWNWLSWKFLMGNWRMCWKRWMK